MKFILTEKGSIMLNGNNMDGISLDGIFGMLRPFLPTISYMINMITKAFEIFTSYLGFEITLPTPEEDSSVTDETIE